MATSLATLRSGGQELADKVSDNSIATATWNGWVNQYIEDLWRKIRTAYGDNFYKTKDFSLAGGVGTGSQYDLNANVSDFRAAKFLEKDPDTTMRRKIRRFNFNQKDGAQRYFPFAPIRRYRVMGLTLIIEPFEFAGGNYRLYYEPAPTLLVGDSDTLDPMLEQWNEYPMVGAAIKGLGKEESDPGWLQERLAELRMDIDASAPDTDIGEPDIIGDIGYMDNPYPWR